MGELLKDLFGRYGLAAIVAALGATILVWAIAHQVAAPGGQVKVLWGLVEYTKDKAPPPTAAPTQAAAPSSNPANPATNSAVPSQTQSVSEPANLPILVASAIPASDVDSAIKSLRSKRGLRELAPLETGRPIPVMPFGTYGFVYSFSFEPFFGEQQGSSTVYASNNSPGAKFEIHKTANGDVAIIAFVSQSDATRIFAPANGPVDATLFPLRWSDARDLVSIPAKIFSWAHSREIETGERLSLYVLDAHFFENKAEWEKKLIPPEERPATKDAKRKKRGQEPSHP